MVNLITLTTTFNDIFKNSFMNEINISAISVFDIFTTLLMSLILGIVVFFIYKRSFLGVVYSYAFNVTLLGMTMVTAVIVRTITSNVLLSLGMVGALSIVRFRTSIKDPKDIMFLFFAITLGITSGAGLYLLSFVSAVFIGIVFLVATNLRSSRRNYILIIKYNMNSHPEILKILSRIKYTIKARTNTEKMSELTIELKLSTKVDQTSLVSQFSVLEGVDFATLVQYNGDYSE